MSSVFWSLVRKDLYLMRGFMVSTIVAGALGIGITMLNRSTGLAVGGILFLTANMAGAIFIAMYTLLTERKELTRLFALSLPISGPRYAQSKLVGGYLAFLMPWALLTILAMLPSLLMAGAFPGMVVYIVVLQGFVLALFSIVVGALFVVTSELASGLLILAVNILFSLFMVAFNQPDVTQPFKGPHINWTPFALRMLAVEALVIILSMVFTAAVIARRRDHV